MFCDIVMKPENANIKDMLSAEFKFTVLRTGRFGRPIIQSFIVTSKNLLALSEKEADVLLVHASAVVDSLVNNIKCRTVILSPLPRCPTRCHPSPKHSEPGPSSAETINLIRDLNYLCQKPSCLPATSSCPFTILCRAQSSAHTMA